MSTRPAMLKAPGAPSPRALALLGIAAAAGLGLLAGAEPLLAVAAGGTALAGIAIVARPDIATLAVAAILYSNVAAVAVKSHGLPFAVGAAFPLLLIVPLAFHLVMRREPLVIAPAFPWVLAFLVVNLIGTMLASDPQAAFRETRTLFVEGVVIFFLVTNVVRTSELLRRVIWLLLLVGAFLAALSVFQQFTHTYDNNYLGFAQVSQQNQGFTTGQQGLVETTQRRLGGPFEGGGENRFAQILLVLAPLAVFCLWTEWRRLLRLLAAAALVLIAFGIVLTFSRGAAIASIVLVAIMAFLRFVKVRHVAAMVAGAALVLAAVPSYWVRISTLEAVPSLAGGTSSEAQPDTSVQSRGTENLAAALIWIDHPIVGVGPGLYPQYYELYADRVGDYANRVEIRHKYTTRQAHNLYLAVLAENGVLGFMALMAILFVTLRELNRVRRRALESRPELSQLAAGFMLAVLAYMTTGIFLHLAYQRYLFFLLALAAAASSIAVRELAADAKLEPVREREPRLPFWRPAGGR